MLGTFCKAGNQIWIGQYYFNVVTKKEKKLVYVHVIQIIYIFGNKNIALYFQFFVLDLVK